MTHSPLLRRQLLTASLAAGALVPAAVALGAGPRRSSPRENGRTAHSGEFGIVGDGQGDQTAALQRAIDQTALNGVGLVLGPGRYRVSGLRLRAGLQLKGESHRSVLVANGPGAVLVGEGATGVRLGRLRLQGGIGPSAGSEAGLVELRDTLDIGLDDLAIAGAPGNGVTLVGCSGWLSHCTVERAGLAGILSLDAKGLEIADNTVLDCANNGILVWRSKVGEDGTRIAGNRIERIRADAGGSGQNGNGINVFRAGGVLVTGNRIADCAYTAVRANAASNVQMVANSCSRLGEVALYAEFGFEGALIASNLVDGAGTGISVTNFNEGGRLAVIQGNLVRNLRRREHEPVDKRGNGIAVEADAVVSGNTIEAAASAGVVLGFGPYLRDIVAASNVIRDAGIGIAISGHSHAGSALVAQNMISGARDGAIRLIRDGRAVGADLALVDTQQARLQVAGNMVVGGRS